MVAVETLVGAGVFKIKVCTDVAGGDCIAHCKQPVRISGVTEKERYGEKLFR